MRRGGLPRVLVALSPGAGAFLGGLATGAGGHRMVAASRVGDGLLDVPATSSACPQPGGPVVARGLAHLAAGAEDRLLSGCSSSGGDQLEMERDARNVGYLADAIPQHDVGMEPMLLPRRHLVSPC